METHRTIKSVLQPDRWSTSQLRQTSGIWNVFFCVYHLPALCAFFFFSFSLSLSPSSFLHRLSTVPPQCLLNLFLQSWIANLVLRAWPQWKNLMKKLVFGKKYVHRWWNWKPSNERQGTSLRISTKRHKLLLGFLIMVCSKSLSPIPLLWWLMAKPSLVSFSRYSLWAIPTTEGLLPGWHHFVFQWNQVS